MTPELFNEEIKKYYNLKNVVVYHILPNELFSNRNSLMVILAKNLTTHAEIVEYCKNYGNHIEYMSIESNIQYGYSEVKAIIK